MNRQHKHKVRNYTKLNDPFRNSEGSRPWVWEPLFQPNFNIFAASFVSLTGNWQPWGRLILQLFWQLEVGQKNLRTGHFLDHVRAQYFNIILKRHVALIKSRLLLKILWKNIIIDINMDVVLFRTLSHVIIMMLKS